MSAKTLRKAKWFWGWQDEKEEAWLREMAGQGWHLVSPRFPGIYRLAAGEPRNVVYRLDFFSESKKEYQAYLQLFRDAGWEHVGAMSGWQHVRQEARPGESPEIFTDVESKVGKYERLMTYLGMLFAVFVIFLPSLGDVVPGKPTALDVAFVVFWTGLTVLLAFGLVMLYRRIRQLKRG
jgi:hypothetical protein